jgi:chromosome segregation ATPase
MKQPEDNATLELNLATAIDGARRGRGRPAKADALTPAERAKRYRDAKRLANAKENAQSVTQITKKEDSPWREQRRHLEKQLKLAQAEIVTLRREHTLMAAERAAAYRTYDQLAATMAGREDELLKAKTELAATRADHVILAAQGAALNELVRTLEERLKKRGAPRKK